MALALHRRPTAPLAGWRAVSRPRSSSGALCPRPRSLHVTRAASSQSSLGVWESLRLARRKLEVAVREENYAAAAEAKREIEVLQERLPANKALLQGLLDKLELTAAQLATAGSSSSSSASPPSSSESELEGVLRERLATLAQLGELADWGAAQALASALHDGDAVAAAAEEALWALFMACPTPQLQQQMQQGVALMRRPEQWDQALELFDSMVAAAPNFAEAYNKRATVLYLQQRYADAILDCRAVLRMNPYHFAAASGMGMCCGAVGDNAGALAAFQQAVAINPRLRHLRQHIMQLRQMLQEEEQQRRGGSGGGSGGNAAGRE